MDKEKLYKLAERYQNKADTAYNAYQETGITPVSYTHLTLPTKA